jgi:aldehyde dehydrogenase (NAD+)
MFMKDLLKQCSINENNFGSCIGGMDWISTDNSGENVSYCPSNEMAIATVFEASENDYEHIVSKATSAFEEWRKVPAPIRGDLVREMGNALRDKKEVLGSLVSLEMGKIKEEGYGEVQEMIDIADFAVGQSRMLYGKTMHSERPNHRMYEQWHPLGPIGVISAFNFPVAVWAWNAFIAAIAGDVVIWKPSSSTPLTAVAIQHICNDVLERNGYKGIFNLIIGKGSTIGEKMLSDKRLPLISFTGSTLMGRHVAEVVSKRFGKTILELGGNNAILVDETADLDLATPAIVFGAVGTAGQRCTSTRRVILHNSISDTLTDRLLNAYGQVNIGDPLEKETLMGPLLNQGAVDSYLSAIEKVKNAGGEILCGGKIIKGDGYFVEPTIAKVENHWDIVQEETFAPILYLMEYDHLSKAIEMHNNVPQGLSSSMFTTNVQNAELFLSSVGSDCGIANINIGTSGAEIGGAFGGEKETGGGRESGSDSWKQYMRRQTNTINWSDELPLAQGIKFDIN